MKRKPQKYSRLFQYAEESTMVQLTMEAIKAREQNLTYGQMKGLESADVQKKGHWIPPGYEKISERLKRQDGEETKGQ